MTAGAKKLRAKGKQNTSRLTYDVAHAGDPATPVEINARGRDRLKTILKVTPSAKFIDSMAQAIGSYLVDRVIVSVATPKKIEAKFRTAKKRAAALNATITSFSITEQTILGGPRPSSSNDDRHVPETYLPTAALQELTDIISEFERAVESGADFIGAVKKQGAMPNFAERLLATRVADALWREFKERPPLTRGGVFDQTLKWAFAFHERDWRESNRRDVMDLMTIAVDALGDGPWELDLTAKEKGF